MMVLSYATIICQLNVLKLERRRLTNFSSRSYKGKNYGKQEIYIKGDLDSETEIMTKEQMETELGDSCTQVTYSTGSDESEKQICETLKIELENELTTKLDVSEEIITQDIIEKCSENKRCSSLKAPGQRNNKGRRFSEFPSLQKVTLNE